MRSSSAPLPASDGSDIHDVADTYDFVVVITDGQVRFDGSMDEFLSQAPGRDPLVAYAEISGSSL